MATVLLVSIDVSPLRTIDLFRAGARRTQRCCVFGVESGDSTIWRLVAGARFWHCSPPSMGACSQSKKKARLVGAALNPHQRRRVEETTGKAKKVNQQKCLLLTAYDETIMAHPSVKVKYYLCAAPCFSRRPWQAVVWRM